MHSRDKHSNYSRVRANRIAFSKPNPKGLPYNFSLVNERIGGMGLPACEEQIALIAEEYNVGLVISCIEDENCPPVEMFTKFNVKHLSIDWRDRSTITIQSLQPLLREVNRFVEESGKVAVFHCYAGKGRTGTSIAAYEIMFSQMKPKDVIEFVRENRPGSIETEAQEQFLFDMYNHLYPHDPQVFEPSAENFQNLRFRLKPHC